MGATAIRLSVPMASVAVGRQVAARILFTADCVARGLGAELESSGGYLEPHLLNGCIQLESATNRRSSHI
jgi:hypothetical protein